MSSCSGKCGSCSSKTEGYGSDFNPKRYPNKKDEDFSELMKNVPKPEGDSTPLNTKCPHYEFGEIERSGCNICIKNWVIAHSVEECKEMINQLKEQNKIVAYRRIEEELRSK